MTKLNTSETKTAFAARVGLTKGRISQLVAELEANKEAQSIVLETKESVMRSLARQNSQLTLEVQCVRFVLYVCAHCTVRL